MISVNVDLMLCLIVDSLVHLSMESVTIRFNLLVPLEPLLRMLHEFAEAHLLGLVSEFQEEQALPIVPRQILPVLSTEHVTMRLNLLVPLEPHLPMLQEVAEAHLPGHVSEVMVERMQRIAPRQMLLVFLSMESVTMRLNLLVPLEPHLPMLQEVAEAHLPGHVSELMAERMQRIVPRQMLRVLLSMEFVIIVISSHVVQDITIMTIDKRHVIQRELGIVVVRMEEAIVVNVVKQMLLVL